MVVWSVVLVLFQCLDTHLLSEVLDQLVLLVDRFNVLFYLY